MTAWEWAAWVMAAWIGFDAAFVVVWWRYRAAVKNRQRAE